MRKRLLILAGLIALGGTTVTAQTQWSKDNLKKEHKKELKEKKERKEAPSEYTFFGKAKSDAAKDGGDSRLTLTPNGTMQFTINSCDETKSRPLVIKNNSDERITGIFQFQDAQTGNYLYPDLGDYVFNHPDIWYNYEILNYFEVNGYAYTFSYYNDFLVKTDLATGAATYKYCQSGTYRSLAYDGKTFWAADYDGNIYALDADLNPTGKKIEVGYSVLVVWNGTELLTFERGSYTSSRVKSFDTNGNLKADYGTVNYYFYYSVNYNPVTGLFWTSDDYCNTSVFSFENGEMSIKDLFYYNGVVAGFDADGNPYITYWDNDILYKTENFSKSPKGIEMSQSYFELGAGEQVTINITATAELGSRTIKILNNYNLFTTLEINVDAEPEYEATSSLQFSAFAGYEANTQTAWIKNIGCQPIWFDEIPSLGTDNYSIVNFVPDYFEGYLAAGDSVGAIIGFYTENTGEYKDTLTVVTENAGTIKIPFVANVSELNYTLPDDVVTATLNCSANTATIAATITNNSNVALKIPNFVEFEIHTGQYSDEMKWELLNSDGNVVASQNYGHYASFQAYTEIYPLVAGNYTLVMYDGYGDGWDGHYGYINIIANGKTVLSKATVNNIGLEDIEISEEATFTISSDNETTIANGQTINQFTLSLVGLSFNEPNKIPIMCDNIVVDYIYVALTPGEPEMTIAESIDFGSQAIDPDNSYLYGSSVLTIANTGCGPLSISSLAIGEGDFIFLDPENPGEFTKTLPGGTIAPRQTVEIPVFFMPSEIGPRTATLTITTADNATTTVQLSGTGTGLPIVEYSYYYDAENNLGFKPDTVGCDVSSVTLKGRVANSGTTPLVITEPIKFEYQAGTYNNGSFSVYYNNGNNWDYLSFYSSDWVKYVPLTEGYISLYPNGSNGKLIISNGTKILQTINLSEAYNDQIIEFAATETQTIDVDDTLELEMTVPLNGNTGDYYNYYYLATNDPYNKSIEMYGSYRVINAPKLVFPEVIDFGEVSVGTEAWQYVTYENEGCGNFGFENFWIADDESQFDTDWSEIGFVPTEAGSFTSTLKVATYFYTVGSETKKDTFEITLKGIAVVSPTAVFEDELVATIDYDKKIATATATVTNAGTSTALKLMNNTDTIVVAAGASTDIVFEIPIKGRSYTTSTAYEIFSYNTNDAENPYIEFSVAIDIEERFEYDFNKKEVAFTPVHIGKEAYSSIILRNHGTENVGHTDAWFKEGDKFEFDGVTDIYWGSRSVAYPDDSLVYHFIFSSDEPGIFRDTFYIEHGTLKTDTIPVVGIANTTQAIAVSTPNGRYAVAGDVIDINVTFDNQVIVFEDSDAMPQLKMNTNSFAVLDSTAFDTDRDDTYTFTFHYTVAQNDNVDLFDYAEDTVYMNGHIVYDIDGEMLKKVTLPAVGTLASTFPVTIDNKIPQLVDSVFNLSLADMTLSFSIKFSEPVTGLNENCISLTGATLVSLTTKDNITYSAVVELEHCVDIVVDIDATLKDLAGNAKKISESKKIPAIHTYTATVVAPTCTAEGYTQLVCSLCNHQEKTNVVAATGHKPGAAVKENETADGYDEVVYCTVCHAELSREHKVILESAIAENAASALIYGHDGAIIVEFAEADGREISVFDISGRAVAKAQANSTRTVIAMPEAGMYVVRVGQQSEKVVLQ